MSRIDPQKYIVFNREEFEKLIRGADGSSTQGNYKMRPFEAIEKEGATTILPEDLFAAPALSMYAAAIGVALNLFPPNHPEREHLLALADYFNNQAEEAAEKGYKVPD